MIGASLSKPHTRVTALSMCVCIWPAIYACLNRPLTVAPNEYILIFHNVHADMYFMKCYCQTARSTYERERERRRFKLNALAARTVTFFLKYGESDDRVTRQATSDGQQDVHWLQARIWCDRSYIAWIPLLPHGLTRKLSPCQCSQVVRLDE